MKNYLGLAGRFLRAHPRRGLSAIASVALSVGLVVAVFSMIDALVGFERADVERKEGSYHLLVRNASGPEAAAIARRHDVESSGYLFDLGKGSLQGSACAFASIDESIAGRLIFRLSSGRYPRAAFEVMVEEWTLRERKLGLGDSLDLILPSGEKFPARIVGSMEDSGATRAAAIPAVFVSPARAASMTHASADYFIRFKPGVNPSKAEASLASELGLSASRIGRNEGLLALSLESRNNRVLKLYAIGAFLFLLVLVTAVVMDPAKVNLAFESGHGYLEVCKNGGPIPFNEEKAKRVLGDTEVSILVDLGMFEGGRRILKMRAPIF